MVLRPREDIDLAGVPRSRLPVVYPNMTMIAPTLTAFLGCLYERNYDEEDRE